MVSESNVIVAHKRRRATLLIDIYEIIPQIEEAVSLLQISDQEFKRCDDSTADAVVAAAMDRFVNGNPRSWWLSLKLPVFSYREFPNSEGSLHLLEFVPDGQKRCWFIPETETTSLPVYDASIDTVVRVLHECSFFEYYLVGKEIDWLVIENDHNEVLVVHATVESETSR